MKKKGEGEVVIKKIAKKTVNTTIYRSKRFLDSKPKTKARLIAALSRHYRLHAPNDEQARYNQWVLKNLPHGGDFYKQKEESKSWQYRPLISIITPTYNTNISFLEECIESVLGQSYQNWELCIVDDCSTDKKVLTVIESYAQKDSRIKYSVNKKNSHISETSNNAAKLASGEFVALLDHDDILWPNALYEVAKTLNKNKKLDFIYSDEDKINEQGKQYQNPFFKPDWNPEFLHSVNYITHFSVIRKNIFERVGGFRKKYDGAQDWDLFMRVTHETKNIHHIPLVLYSWRMSDTSTAKSTDTKPYVVKSQKEAIEDDLKRKGHKNFLVKPDKKNINYWTVSYEVKNSPLVSIVIPTKDQFKVVKNCIDSIINKTTHKNYEIIIVDTGSRDSKVWSWYRDLQKKHKNIKVIDFVEPVFSYTKACNYGAKNTSGEYLVMLNNDTEVMSTNWLDTMLGYTQRGDIGAVGCKLMYPGDTLVQHAGVGIGLGGVAANLLSPLSEVGNTPIQNLYMNCTRNVSAVTAACLMIEKDLFNEVSGFDNEFSVTYNDVDLCLRLLDRGYSNVYIPFVKLIHHESISLGKPDHKKRNTEEFLRATRLFKKRWKKYIENDPALNPNFDKTNSFLNIKA